jgi:hypothetical protein
VGSAAGATLHQPCDAISLQRSGRETAHLLRRAVGPAPPVNILCAPHHSTARLAKISARSDDPQKEM